MEFVNKLDKYRNEGWLKQGLSTYDVWQKLDLKREKATIRRSTAEFNIYRDYVNTTDDHIIRLEELRFPKPNLISKIDDLEEPSAKTSI